MPTSNKKNIYEDDEFKIFKENEAMVIEGPKLCKFRDGDCCCPSSFCTPTELYSATHNS